MRFLLCVLICSLGASSAWALDSSAFSLEVSYPEGRLNLEEARHPGYGLEEEGAGESAGPAMDPQEAMRLLRLRRKMMNAHETLALATWGVMTANMVFASMNHAWRVGAVTLNRNNSQFYTDVVPKVHRVLAYGGAGLYLTTGLIAWTAPKAISVDALPGAAALASKHKDSGKIHRKLSYAHAAGMGAAVLNGILSAYVIGPNVDTNTYHAAITTHLAIGYVTYALVTAAGLIILLT